MTELDLTAIKARTEAATEGPWKSWNPASGPSHLTLGGKVAWESRQSATPFGDDEVIPHWADATFIAAARTDVPALVAEVERLRGIEAGAREAGRIIDRLYEAQRPVVDAAGLGHLLADDGDGDWGQVWELLAQIVAAARTVGARRDALAAQVERVRLAASDWITGAAHLEDTDPGVAAVMTELADDVHRALDGEPDRG